MRDRFTRGFAAGVTAGIVTAVFNLGVFYLNISTLRWADFMAILSFGSFPSNLGETVFATIAVFIFLGFIGVVFAYLVKYISSQNYLLKTWAYGTFIWFTSFAVMQLFAVPELANIPLATTVSNFVGASIWGLTYGLILKWLDNRVEI